MIPQLLPDLFLLLVPFLALFAGMFSRRDSALPFHVAWISLGISLVLYNLIPVGGNTFYLSNWRIDSFGVLIRQTLVLSALGATWLAKEYFDRGGDQKAALSQPAEFYASLAFVTIGGVVVVSACELVTLFLGLELATIPMYFLVAWNRREPLGSEAATKYILMGSVATAVELFGFGYLYGFAGSVQLSAIASAVASEPMAPMLWISVLFIVSALGFKLTLFPFHTWAPDVYEGAPTPVTAFLSVSSKITAIAFLAVLVYGPLSAIHERMTPFLALLAASTLFVGNLGALRQTRLRRFMAYSSIAQAGYLLIALCGSSYTGRTALVFYMFIYAFTNYLAFFIIGIIGEKRPESFASLRGLSRQSPLLATLFALAMFSLAGIPPLAGFMGKFMLFSSAASRAQYLLVAFAALNSVLALYYYLQLIKSAWVDEAETELAPLSVNTRQRIALALLACAVLFCGTFAWLNNAIHGILQA